MPVFQVIWVNLLTLIYRPQLINPNLLTPIYRPQLIPPPLICLQGPNYYVKYIWLNLYEALNSAKLLLSIFSILKDNKVRILKVKKCR